MNGLLTKIKLGVWPAEYMQTCQAVPERGPSWLAGLTTGLRITPLFFPHTRSGTANDMKMEAHMKRTVLALVAIFFLAGFVALAPAHAALTQGSSPQTVQAEETPEDPGTGDQTEGEAEDLGGGGCGGGDYMDEIEASSVDL